MTQYGSPREEWRALLHALETVADQMTGLEERMHASIAEAAPEYQNSARNLVSYLALRQQEVRALQERLARQGLTSLGRAEGNVRGAVASASALLQAALGEPTGRPVDGLGRTEAAQLLQNNTLALLGPEPADRHVRIMVTMPTEAASDERLVTTLVSAGMDLMRINCAHDGPAEWGAMIDRLRRAERVNDRRCRILMDIAGPKIRTGPLPRSARPLRLHAQKDGAGNVVSPARAWLVADDEAVRDRAERIPVSAAFLRRLTTRDVITLVDMRGKERRLAVVAVGEGFAEVECGKTIYLKEGTALAVAGRRGTRVGPLPTGEDPIVVKPAEHLVLRYGTAVGRPGPRDSMGRLIRPPEISCDVKALFERMRPGEPILFDDGKIEGVVTHAGADALDIEITRANPLGGKLRSGKGINTPDTDLGVPALSAKDLRDLDFVAERADLVGLSFVNDPSDVLQLYEELERRGAHHVGVVLKIETKRAFANLPKLLLAAMRRHPVGVMIARGDLAVECGFERMAEVQEELLWVCEAAHLPVIWATQVLENLARKGLPSRAEITDAAMGERAECVMLNKGPYITDAVTLLTGILQRMEGHQSKKFARLRPLRMAAIEPDAFVKG